MIKNLEEFAKEIGLPVESLQEISNDINYKTFKIKKRNGKLREINAPNFKLKVIQKWILLNILEKVSVSVEATAFRKNSNGIKENANKHINQKYILEIDIKDFYPSIRFSNVVNLFRYLGYDKDFSLFLGKICTFNGKLPQGGVTSPYISNLIFKSIDKKLSKYCLYKNINYSRYADDLTFSSNDKKVLLNALIYIRTFFTQSQFQINEDKTRLLSPSSHKIITGITINNGELKVNKKIKRLVRALIYYGIKNDNFIKKDKIIGNIAFVNSIESGYSKICAKYITNCLKKFNKDDKHELLKIVENIK